MEKRPELFQAILNDDTISLSSLREHCFQGIPEGDGLRALCWMVLLNHLPVATSEWHSRLQQSRSTYANFIQELIVNPGLEDHNDSFDHPLNANPGSEWNTFFKDNEVLFQIDKDCRRLCPGISFFQQATAYPCRELVDPNSKIENLRRRVENTVLKSGCLTKNKISKTPAVHDPYEILSEGEEAHWEVVERILFIFAKLNPGQSYVQGMNEVLGPLYYTMASNTRPGWAVHAEADTFFCFMNLMSEIRDNFIKSCDRSQSGIMALMDKTMSMIKHHRLDVWLSLDKQGIKPEFFAFRWLTLLFSQEFELPDVIRIWDTLFADESRFSFLVHLACAMVLNLDYCILQNDFSISISTLQQYPDTDICKILNLAYSLKIST